MELEKLLKQRDAYAGKILKLGILIAVIFLLPAVISIIITRYFSISYIYTLGGAFVTSWVLTLFLYRDIARKVKKLEKRIKELQGQAKSENNQHTL